MEVRSEISIDKFRVVVKLISNDASFGRAPPSCDDHTSGSDILLLLIIEVSQRLLVQPGAWTDVDAELFYLFALAQPTVPLTGVTDIFDRCPS